MRLRLSAGMPSNMQLHVGERVDRDADIADLGGRHLVIGVVAALGRQIERDQDLLGADLDQLAEALVAGLGVAEAGIGRDHERIGAVHAGPVAAGERDTRRESRDRAGSRSRSARDARACRAARPRCRYRSTNFLRSGPAGARRLERLLQPARAFAGDVLARSRSRSGRRRRAA